VLGTAVEPELRLPGFLHAGGAADAGETVLYAVPDIIIVYPRLGDVWMTHSFYDNPLWGAPRIHGELLKLGFEVAQSTVSKYMITRRGPPSQGWRTFLRNHAEAIAAIDLCAAELAGTAIGVSVLLPVLYVRGRQRAREIVRRAMANGLSKRLLARQATPRWSAPE
jgi:hypothetical protein